jgi:rhamnulose-1-phosphate aldolase
MSTPSVSLLEGRPGLAAAVGQVAEVAGYLWEKGWAERNGGNITLNVTEFADEQMRNLPAISQQFPIGFKLEKIIGFFFYCKGTNKRMRDLARWPMAHGSIIRVCPNGTHYEIVGDSVVMPTSEICSHLLMHEHFQNVNNGYKAVVHTHPTELIAMSHCEEFLKKDVLTQLLWSMIPETRAFCPKGLGIVKYKIPGSTELAEATVEQLGEYDVVLWEKHGVVSVSTEPGEAFDMIDTLVKSSLIYIASKNMGFTPTGLTSERLNAMKATFKLAGRDL